MRGIDEYTNMAGASSTAGTTGFEVGREDPRRSSVFEGGEDEESFTGSIDDMLIDFRCLVPGLIGSADACRLGAEDVAVISRAWL